MMWVYQSFEKGLYTTGYYSPDGKWHGDRDFGSKEEAATRVNYLNGGEVKHGTVVKEAK